MSSGYQGAEALHSCSEEIYESRREEVREKISLGLSERDMQVISSSCHGIPLRLVDVNKDNSLAVNLSGHVGSLSHSDSKLDEKALTFQIKRYTGTIPISSQDFVGGGINELNLISLCREQEESS